MNVFCLKQGQGFEILGGTILLEFPLSAPAPPPPIPPSRGCDKGQQYVI